MAIPMMGTVTCMYVTVKFLGQYTSTKITTDRPNYRTTTELELEIQHMADD